MRIKLIIGFIVILSVLFLSDVLKSHEQFGYKDPDVILAKACTQKNCKQEVILINGMITENTPTKLRSILKSNTLTTTTVCFNSPGGAAKGAYIIGNLIAENNFNTCIAEGYVHSDNKHISQVICGSSCPVALLAGKERYAHGIMFEIFVHASGSLRSIFGFDITSEHSPEEQKMVKQEILETIRGYSKPNLNRVQFREAHDSLIERAFKTPHEEMDRIEINEAFTRYKIFTSHFIPI